MLSQDLIDRFCQAIAREEGFYIPDSVPQRSNNPGDLADGDIGNGVIQTAGPNGAAITVFANAADGWAALARKVRRMLSGASEVYTLDLTISEVGMKYSGSTSWGDNVARFLGVPSTTTLAEIAQADLQQQGTEIT